MKPLFAILAIFVLISSVSAGNPNYSVTFDSGEIVRINQSYVLDPTDGHSVPFEFYLLSGAIGLILLVLALVKPKTKKLDYEVDIILSVMSWPFIAYFAWAGLTSVDRIVGSGVTGANGEWVSITQHILYKLPLLGYLGVVALIFSIFITLLLISQFKLFRDNVNEETR